VLSASGLPVTIDGIGWLPAVTLAQALAAVAFGAALGSTLPLVIAAPVAIVAVGLWFLTPGSWGDLGWYNIVGTNVGCCGSVDVGPPTALLIALPVHLVATVLCTLVAAGRSRLKRAVLLVAAGSLGVAGALAAITGGLVAAVDDDFLGPRFGTSLHCEGDAPEICLWPEQEAAFGEEARSALTTAYAETRARGVAIPPLIVPATGADTAAIGGGVLVSSRLDDSVDELVASFARGAVSYSGCRGPEYPSDFEPVDSAGYALARVLDVSDDAALPRMFTTDAEGHDRELVPAEVRDALGVHTRAEAAAVVASGPAEWFCTFG